MQRWPNWELVELATRYRQWIVGELLGLIIVVAIAVSEPQFIIPAVVTFVVVELFLDGRLRKSLHGTGYQYSDRPRWFDNLWFLIPLWYLLDVYFLLKATRGVLRDHGMQVGFLGVRQSELEKLKDTSDD